MSRSNSVRSRVSSLHLETSLPVLDHWVLFFRFVGYLYRFLQHQIQITRPIILQKIVGGGRGDKHFLVYDFFRFQHNCFRNTISRECIVEDDCVRSCLIELHSFALSKLNIDPVHRILVHFPLVLVRCKTWFGQIKLWWIFVILMHGIHGCKEYRLSVPPRILSSR